MHHIFYVQSGISVAIAQKAIKQLQLNKEKCIFLTGRSVQIDGDFIVKDTSEWSFRTSLFFFVGWWKSLKSKRLIKDFLREQQVASFKMYTASFGHWFYYLLSKDKRCKEIWALEEGRASFYTEEEFKKYVKIFHYSSPKYLTYQIKAWFNHFFVHYPNPNKTIKILKKHDRALVTSLKSYTYISNRIVIENPFDRADEDYSDIKCLMAMSYPVEDGLISIENYTKAIEDTYEQIIKLGYTTIHYKFHPQQLTNPKFIESYQLCIQRFSNQINFIELPKSTILEVVAANSNATVLSDYSSLIIYADTFGNKIYSNFSLLEKQEPEIKNRLGLLPQILLDLMHKNKFY
ncbi:MAG: polysialyltransferase family glycosyltransferase [Crocinitomicaceae bacterium]